METSFVPLKEVRPGEMRQVLAHERGEWERVLGWDFATTSALIERSIAARVFSGFALRSGGRVVAYCYFLADTARSLLGSVHCLPEAEADKAAARLTTETLSYLIRGVGTQRIEGQLLYFGGEDPGAVFAAWGARRYARQFLSGALDPIRDRLAAAPDATLRPFQAADRSAAAHLVHLSFRGEPDADMSECYRTLVGCESFIEGALARHGCGTYEPRASFLASHQGRPAGLILVSRIAPTLGHIVQISIAPSAQGLGIGKALMRAAAEALARRGFTGLSLSVTVENQRARAWYLNLGFQPVKDYAAYVWQRA